MSFLRKKAWLLMVLAMLITALPACKAKPETTSSSTETSGYSSELDESVDSASSLSSSDQTSTASTTGNGTTKANTSKGTTTKAQTPSRVTVFTTSKKTSDLSGRVTDLHGRTVRITVGYRMDGDTTSADGILNAANIARIEKKYNCKLKQVPFQPDTTKASIVAGQPDTDIWNLTNSDFFTTTYNSQMIQPLDDLKCIDFSDYSTFSNLTEFYNINGKHWAMNPQTYGITSICVNTCMYANKKMLSSKGVNVQDIYNLQNSGKWTWSEFQKIAKKVTDPANGVYAIQDTSALFYQSLLASNSTDFILKQNNKLVFNGGSTQAKNVMSFYADLVADKSLNPVAGTANSLFGDNASFMAGKNYFACGVVAWHSPKWNYIKDQASNIAVFNIPKPTASASYKSYLTGVCPYVIPVFSGKDANLRAREAATIMSELFAPLKTQAQYVQDMKNDCMIAAGGDTNSYNTLMGLLNQTVFSYSYMGKTVVTTPNANPKTGWLDVIHTIASSPSSYQSVVDANKSSYNSILGDILKQN